MSDCFQLLLNPSPPPHTPPRRLSWKTKDGERMCGGKSPRQHRPSGESFHFPGVDELLCSHFNSPPRHIIGHHLGLSLQLPSSSSSSTTPHTTADMRLHVCRTSMLRGGNPTSGVNPPLHVSDILCNSVMTANYKAGFSLFLLKNSLFAFLGFFCHKDPWE